MQYTLAQMSRNGGQDDRFDQCIKQLMQSLKFMDLLTHRDLTSSPFVCSVSKSSPENRKEKFKVIDRAENQLDFSAFFP